MGNYLLLFEVLISLIQTGYDTLLLHIGLLHFGVILCHLLQIGLEMLQIIMGFLIELIELNIFLLYVFSFPNNLFHHFQFIGQHMVFMLDPIHLPLNCD